MKRFATYPKVETDIHNGGSFFSEKYRDILELSEDGEITILRESQSAQSSSLPRFVGSVTEEKRAGFSATLKSPDTGVSIALDALVQGDELICHFSSLCDAGFESELFVRT